jgi:phenylacetate-CoA ligase
MGMNQINTDYPGAPQSGAVETASRTQLRQWQEERLVSLYQRTWKSILFYRKRWEEHGLRADDIRSLDDIAMLPVISKGDFESDLAEHPPFGSYQGDFPAIRLQASSGSSGNPKPFFQTRNDWEVIANLWSRRFYAQGVRAGDVFQKATKGSHLYL